jgi:hypothetical protein
MFKRLYTLVAAAALTGSVIGAGLSATPATRLAGGGRGGVIDTVSRDGSTTTAQASRPALRRDGGRGGLGGEV